MSAVVLMQSLLFQDGGIEALGANIFNMAILGCLLPGFIMWAGKRLIPRMRHLTLAFAGWLSVMGAAVMCAVELALSGTSPLSIVLPAMVLVHAVIGVFEGLVSVIALRFICSVNRRLGFANGVGEQCGDS